MKLFKGKVVATALVVATVLVSNALAQTESVDLGLKCINKPTVESQLEFLASDWMEGREAGTKGNYLAGDYIASMFKLHGLTPMGDNTSFVPNRYQKFSGAKRRDYKSYFQNFSAIESQDSENHSFSVVHNGKNSANEINNYSYKVDFSVSTPLVGKQINAPIVFVGYGFYNKELGYDDFKGVDVKGKIVLRLSKFPGWNDTTSQAYRVLSKVDQRAINSSKNRLAIEKGALAVVEFNVDQKLTTGWETNSDFRFNEAMYEGDKRHSSFYDKRLRLPSDKDYLPIVHITEKVVLDILAKDNISLASVMEKSIKLKSSSQKLKASIDMKISVKTRSLKLRNILGVIEGENTNEIVIIGAHYDHLGKYDGYVFNGADDNGSGVVAVMTIAKAFIESGVKPYRTIIFACWDGEEKGLLGSRAFVKQFRDIGKTVSYLNFDMIARNYNAKSPGNKTAMIYTKAVQQYVDISKENIDKYNLNLDINFSGVDNPTSGSDNSGFAKVGIPIFWFHTGGHTDYHKASDHVELINWDKLCDIIRLSYLDMWKLANDKSIFDK